MEIIKNYLKYSLWFVLIVFAALLGLHWLPVLMTTATTVLGMIPMAIGGGQGSEMWSPMAIAVIGGLTISTVLTLILIPTLYCVFAGTGIKNRRRKLRRQRELDVYFQANKDNIIKK